MQVQGQKALAVIDHHEVALVVKRSGEQYGAVIHRRHGSSAGDAEIKAKVRTGGLVIEDALGAEDVGDGGLGWGGEFSGPFAVWADAVQVILLDGLGFVDLLELLRAGRGKFIFDCE